MNGDIDISTSSAFAGLMTYANLPYAHCLAAKGAEVGKYDIAILGAPFDTVGSPPFLFLVVRERFVGQKYSSGGHMGQFRADYPRARKGKGVL